MASDHFQNQMNWLQGLSGDEQIKAGSVVAWQCIAATLNELVKNFNNITFGSDNETLKRNREVQLKKMIIGMLYEMDSCLDYWTKMLNDDGLLKQPIKDKKKQFKTACKKVGLDVLKQVRNGVAFHFTDYLTDPTAIKETYTKIDHISLDSINEILRSGNSCGFAMRDEIMNSMS